MSKVGLVLVGGGIGALVGAALARTKIGEEVDEKLEDAFEKLNDDVVPFLEKIANLADDRKSIKEVSLC
mgnify:FL=1